MKSTLLIVITLATTALGLELTPDTWDTETAGKTVFLKFFAPWCGHCKAMKPAWDTLMGEFDGSSGVLVADVDCIGSGKALCETFGVKGFPTIKHGDASALEDYKGGRDLATLKAFAAAMGPMCDAGTLENCNDAQKDTIKGLKSKSVAELEVMLADGKEQESVAETTFKVAVQKLQDTYTKLLKSKEDTLAGIHKASAGGLIKSVIAFKKNKQEL